MTQDSAITQEMGDAVGVDSEPAIHEVEKGAIVGFARAIGDTSPLFNDERAARNTRYGTLIAPPTFLRSMPPGPSRAWDASPYSANLDGGSQWEYFEPVRSGDTIEVTVKLTEVSERQGRLGNMLFTIRETTYANQFGARVALQRGTSIGYEPAPGGSSPGAAATREPRTYTGSPPPHGEDHTVGRLPEQLYFDDVEEGMELPVLEKDPTTLQLVRYAGASGDYHQIHYDLDFAQAKGLPDIILHGALKNAFLGQLMTDWIGEHGTLKKLSAQYRGMDVPGKPVYAKGVVSKTYVEGDQNLVECEIWLEDHKGEKTTPGSAVVSLPSRNG